jgi:chaperonin GroES
MAKKPKIQPLADRVLVEPAEASDAQIGGIIIPDSAKEKPQEGTVVALGTGRLDEDGKKIAFNVKVGDKVLMPKYGGTDVKVNDVEYQIVREDDILAIVG